MDNNNITCTECQLPVKEYKQNIQVRKDICENCHISDTTYDIGRYSLRDIENNLYPLHMRNIHE